MPCTISLSADRTFIGASLHLVRGHGIRGAVAHLVIAVKAAGLALWLRFVGLERTMHSRHVEMCSYFSVRRPLQLNLIRTKK